MGIPVAPVTNMRYEYMQRCRRDYNKKLEMYLRQIYTETKDMQKSKCDNIEKLEMYLNQKTTETKDMQKCKCDYSQKLERN